MMADNTRYSETGIGFSQYPVTPTVNPIGRQVRAQLAGDISSLLDRMAAPLYKKAADDAQREGMMWAAQNPVTVDQLNAAVAAGNDPLAERGTFFGDAARKVQAAVLGSQLNAQGMGEMARIQAAAEIGQIPLSVAAEKMDALSAAYSNALTKVDPESGIRLRATLTSHSSSVYSTIAQGEVKRFQAAQKATVDQWFAELPKRIETEFLAGDTVDPATGTVIPAEARVNAQRAQAVQAARITGDATYGTKFDKAVSEARVSAFTKLLSDPSYAKDPATALSRIMAEDIGDAHKVAWKGMSEADKTKVQEEVVKAYAQRYEVIKKTSDADRLQSKKQIDALLLEYLSPGTTGKRKTEIDREVRALGIDPQEYKSMFKPADGSSVGPDREAEIADMIDRRVITDFTQLRQVASGEALKRLQVKLRVETTQAERDAEGILLEAVAGTKSPVAALDTKMQQEKYQLQNVYRAEVARLKATGKPFSYSDVAIGIADQYKQKKFDGKVKPQRDALTQIEAELSQSMGRQITITSMNDIAQIETMGGWKGRNTQKARAMEAVRILNSPILIQGQPQP